MQSGGVSFWLCLLFEAAGGDRALLGPWVSSRRQGSSSRRAARALDSQPSFAAVHRASLFGIPSAAAVSGEDCVWVGCAASASASRRSSTPPRSRRSTFIGKDSRSVQAPVSLLEVTPQTSLPADIGREFGTWVGRAHEKDFVEVWCFWVYGAFFEFVGWVVAFGVGTWGNMAWFWWRSGGNRPGRCGRGQMWFLRPCRPCCRGEKHTRAQGGAEE